MEKFFTEKLNPSVQNPFLERERQGRARLRPSWDRSRASHPKPQEVGGVTKRQNCIKPLWTKGDLKSAPLPMWGRVWGYPKTGSKTGYCPWKKRRAESKRHTIPPVWFFSTRSDHGKAVEARAFLQSRTTTGCDLKTKNELKNNFVI
jgi:hypothetical protein